MTALAEVGVFGGSGFQRLLDEVEMVRVATPHGEPSGEVAVGNVAGRRVAFLPRHGPGHRLPPAAINYRANLWAFRELGVTRVLAPTAVGSLRPGIRPGDFVVCDQLVDRTWGRADTFHAGGPRVAHPSLADPYCPELRPLAVAAGRTLGVTVHGSGTVVVIQGPRFSTRAESRWFAAMGWDVVNMTQYPEAALARELELCYATIALVTDHDAGVEGDDSIGAVTVTDVEAVMAANNRRARELVLEVIRRLPAERGCDCGRAMEHAFIDG